MVKVPISKVLLKTLDGRKVDSLKRRALNMSQENPPPVEFPLFKNYIKLVECAVRLRDSVLTGVMLEEAELNQILTCLSAEGIDLPKNIRASLVTRKVKFLMEQKDLAGMMNVITPFHKQPWDPFDPKAAAVGDDQATLLETFTEVAFIDVLQSMLQTGSTQAAQALAFCKQCISFFEEVDPVDLDQQSAICLAESFDVWRAIVGIADDVLDLTLQEPRVFESSYLYLLNSSPRKRQMCRGKHPATQGSLVW